ncbi:hypothetical protein VNO78_20065 [Psophocarpus tetragonolobus]|uniref:Uncharacterized protein n=1 Tax=Psophocarpus tetragonolobus TaxID=3891 RepID=A0AAN9S8P6_PSOTE
MRGSYLCRTVRASIPILVDCIHFVTIQIYVLYFFDDTRILSLLFHYVGRVKVKLFFHFPYVSSVFVFVRFLRNFGFWRDIGVVLCFDFQVNGFLPSSSISLNFYFLLFFFGISHQKYQREHKVLLLMDTKSIKDANGRFNKPMALTVTLTVASVEGRKVEDHSNREDDSDSNSLLPAPRGGMSRKSDKTYNKRKVQWNDRIGNKLVEVLEYVPSDVSDSDSEDEGGDSCFCSIM